MGPRFEAKFNCGANRRPQNRVHNTAPNLSRMGPRLTTKWCRTWRQSRHVAGQGLVAVFGNLTEKSLQHDVTHAWYTACRAIASECVRDGTQELPDCLRGWFEEGLRIVLLRVGVSGALCKAEPLKTHSHRFPLLPEGSVP